MFGAYLSPLAPAVVLLLGAFILPLMAQSLLTRWQSRPALQSIITPALVGLAALALLGVRLTVGADPSGLGLELLSGWNFTTAESAVALTIRADTLSLPFLLLAILILLATTLATPLVLPSPERREENVSDQAIWLALGAGACFLFVSANGLTLVYAVLGFDTLTMFYWLHRGQRDLSVARIFLGLFTGVALMLANFVPADAPVPGLWWLGLALWLRVGLYPFFEARWHTRWPDNGSLTYLGLSLSVGLYLTARTTAGDMPVSIVWLVAGLGLLNGLLAWLAEHPPAQLNRLLLAEAALMLLIVPVEVGLVAAFTVGLVLSVLVLWMTPRLGRPRLDEAAWSWPYLPALAATLTLLGLPFTLGWLARTAIYETLLSSGYSTLLFMALLLAESLALSGLVQYWRILWRGDEVDERRSVVGIVAMVPFLIPGLAPLILSEITKIDLPAVVFEQPNGVYVALGVTLLGAIGLGYFRPLLLDHLNLNPETLSALASLTWLLHWVETQLSRLSKLILWIRIVLEGRHYLGWAFFTALVGILILFLGT